MPGRIKSGYALRRLKKGSNLNGNFWGHTYYGIPPFFQSRGTGEPNLGVLAPSGVFRERVPLRSVLQKGSNLLCIERKEIVKGTDKGLGGKSALKRKFGAFRGTTKMS